MKFLTKVAVLTVFALSINNVSFAADEVMRARPGSITGAIVSANTGRMVAMPIAPGITTSTNTVSNMPTVAIIPGPSIPVDFCRVPYFDKAKCCASANPDPRICDVVDFCRNPYFDKVKCCTGPNPDPRICDDDIDYCRKPNFDYKKCCNGPNPDPRVCEDEEIDYCRAPNFDKYKCCTGNRPDPKICNAEIDYCRAPNFDKYKCCTGNRPDPKICNEEIDYCRAPNFDKVKCCTGNRPDPKICNEEIDYCRAPNFDKVKCCTGNRPDPKICNEEIDYCRAPNFDKDKCCTSANPDPIICNTGDCGAIIPSLGVDKCVAKQACESIRADGLVGIFDLETLQCLIPVCAHNWGGIIKASDKNVCAYAPMGTMFKCGTESFEQVKYMRRTSQWVVPVMIVSGAGIGAGIGALVDAHDNKQANQFKAQAKDNDNGKNDFFTGTVVNDREVTWDGTPYQLDDPKSRAALIDKLGLGVKPAGNTPVNNLIIKSNQNADACIRDMFKDLVSPTTLAGEKKFGHIKITSTGDCSNASIQAAKNNVLYCQWDSETDKSRCETVATKDVPSPNGQNNTGTCYFRTGFGPVSANPNADTTASDDLYRAILLSGFLQDSTMLGAKIGNTEELVFKNLNALKEAGFNVADPSVLPSNRNITALQNLKVITTTAFGNIKFKTDGLCENDSAVLDNTRDKLWAAYGAAQGLKKYCADNGCTGVGAVDTGALDMFLAKVEMSAKVTNIRTTAEFDKRVDELFGNKRPFFETATGRGLLVGTGVGALGGLGYWFAEGASVFCNVGGLDQTKLGKYYSIPSFREYITKYGFLK